jgi:ribosomal protein S18 acetylase RimI-like enzyme
MNAELAAKAKGQWFRICVPATNKIARSMYESLGFREHEVQLEKALGEESTLDEGGEGA